MNNLAVCRQEIVASLGTRQCKTPRVSGVFLALCDKLEFVVESTLRPQGAYIFLLLEEGGTRFARDGWWRGPGSYDPNATENRTGSPPHPVSLREPPLSSRRGILRATPTNTNL